MVNSRQHYNNDNSHRQNKKNNNRFNNTGSKNYNSNSGKHEKEDKKIVNISNANIGYLFYKRYFQYNNGKLNLDNVKHINNTLNNYKFIKYDFNQSDDKEGFKLKTTYPGLLLGAGYQHEIKSGKGENKESPEYKLGFFFDYTTGQPIIPGSSIKGILRSSFPDKEDLKDELDGFKIEYLKAKLKNILKGTESVSDKYVFDLKNEIFEGVDNEGNAISPYDRDIFFDGIIVDVIGNDKRILGDDYITPHKDEFSSPIPIKFLKVMPNVVFKFSFDLKDSKSLNITKKQKEELFKSIILDLGVGAKTNIGYGALTTL